MENSPTDTSTPSETTPLSGDGTRKRPTGITATIGYRTKPRRATGLKIIIGFAVTIVVAIMLRLLAAPGGGPLMAAYNFIGALFAGSSPGT